MALKTNSWASYIEKNQYFDLINHFRGNASLIDSILRFKPKTVLEVGCGSGLTSVALAQKGIEVTCVDNNQAVLDYVKELADFYNVKLTLVKKDATQIYDFKNRFDILFSQGLLEHFTNQEIHTLLFVFSWLAQTVIFEVPSEKWPYASSSTSIFGDERFLTRKKWLSFIKKAGLEVTCTYGWGFQSKYRRMFAFLPHFVSKRLSVRFANNLGFICQRSIVTCE